MSVLRDAVQAVINQVENDDDVKDYFHSFDTDEETETVDLPNMRWTLRSVGFRPFATKQTLGITNDISAVVGITVSVASDDEGNAMLEMLQALEIVDNSLEKADITFANKLQNLLLDFDSFETLSEGGRNFLKAEGSITLTVQPYAGGSL